MIEILKRLCEHCACPGGEKDLLSAIENEAKGLEVLYDGMGSLIVAKRCGKEGARRVMLSCSADDPGFIVNYIEENGYLRLTALGGVNSAFAVGRRIVIDGEAYGIVCLDKGAEAKGSDSSRLYADIGASTRAEAEGIVALGDVCCFETGITELFGGKIGGFGTASRICASVILDIVKKCECNDFDLYAAFTVQGGLRARGAKTAPFDVQPDTCICIEPCESFDTPCAERRGEAVIGNGAVILAKTSDYCADFSLRKSVEDAARRSGADFVTCVYTDKTTTASMISRCGKGVPSVAVGIPVRGIGGAEIFSASDAMNVEKTMLELLCGTN